MVRKLYVGNLPFSFSENSLKDLFSPYGTVESVKLVTDTFDGRSKGFAFVEMATEDEANAAIQGLNSKEVEGRSLRVDLARPKESRPRDNTRGPRPSGSGERRGGASSRFGNSNEGRRNRW